MRGWDIKIVCHLLDPQHFTLEPRHSIFDLRTPTKTQTQNYPRPWKFYSRPSTLDQNQTHLQRLYL